MSEKLLPDRGVVSEGIDSYQQGRSPEDCPYPPNSADREAWQKGWNEAASQDADLGPAPAFSQTADETPVEMARRHVAEGKQRLARQRRMIDELGRDGHEKLLRDARALLLQMEEFQITATDHLSRLLNKEG